MLVCLYGHNYSSCTPPNPQCPDQIPSLGSSTNTLPTPQVRIGVLPNLVEKQSLKKEVATQTEEHLPPFEPKLWRPDSVLEN